jgi:hypothetical protein
VGKPAHLEVYVERCVQLPIKGEPTPYAMKSPADLSGNPSTSDVTLLILTIKVYKLHGLSKTVDYGINFILSLSSVYLNFRLPYKL